MLQTLSIGLIFFIVYGKYHGKSFRDILTMAFSNISSIKNITIVMFLVGILTALWRATGTIAFIVSATSNTITPSLFLPSTFLLCSVVSILTGTSIGTAATIGVICMSIGNALGISPAICGGAILSGAYCGDRCSPVSTSALLVSEITGTNLYTNIRGMIRTGWLPTLIALSIYILLGTFSQVENPSTNTTEIFSKYFVLKWYLLLPAISILLLALFRLNVKINMIVSIVISTIIYFIDYPIETNLVNKFIQTFKIMILGFQAPAEISSMMSGGGMIVMAKLILVVLISFTYIGFLKELGILQKIQILILRFAQKISPFGCTTLTACITSALACNQTLSIVLTNEICSKIIPNPKIRAIALENTSVIIAPLIPWTVASLVPLETIGAPTSSIIFASLLYLIPITQWLVNKKATDHKDRSNKK